MSSPRSESETTSAEVSEADDRGGDRCQICGDIHDPDDDVQPRIVEERDIGDLGEGVMGAPDICNWCARLLEAPLDRDGCLICGAAETSRYFEIEGAAGVDEIEVSYAGQLCVECSGDVVLEIQERAVDPAPADLFGPAIQDDGGDQA